MPTTGQLIRAARKAQGLSQNQLARRLGCTGFLVCHWEANRRPVTDMEALAGVLGTTVEALTGETVPPVEPESTKDSRALPILSESPEPYLNITRVRGLLQEFLGVRINNYRVHEWVQAKGLPAYVNPLRKNHHGKPTLLFRRSEIETWLRLTLRPVKAVNE